MTLIIKECVVYEEKEMREFFPNSRLSSCSTMQEETALAFNFWKSLPSVAIPWPIPLHSPFFFFFNWLELPTIKFC